MNIEISIIVPTYNSAGGYLESCLNSCLKQNCTNYEVIVINDGSTDNTAELLQQYSRIRNVHVFNEANHGVAETRNKGIREAKGRYIWFVDSDDLIKPDSVERLIEIARDSDLDLLQFGFRIFYEGEQDITIMSDQAESDDIKFFDTGRQLEDALPQDKRGFVWSYIVKKSVIIENNISFIPGCTFCEDTDFNFYLRRCVKKCAMINSEMYNYRKRAGSITAKVRQNGYAIYNESRIILAKDQKNHFDVCSDSETKKELKRLYIYNIQGCISQSVALGDVAYSKKIIQCLRTEDLYPYHVDFKGLLPHLPVKKWIINVLAIGYHIPAIVYLYTLMFSILGKKKET